MDFDSLKFRMIPSAGTMPPASASDQPQHDGTTRRSLFDRMVSPQPELEHEYDDELDMDIDEEQEEHAVQDENHEPALLKRISSPSQHLHRSPTPEPAPTFELILAQPASKPAHLMGASAPGPDASIPIPLPSIIPAPAQPASSKPSASQIRNALLFFGEVYADAYSVANEWGEHADTLKRAKAQKEDTSPNSLQQDSVAAEPVAKRQKTSHTGTNADATTTDAEPAETSAAPAMMIPASVPSMLAPVAPGTFVPPKGLFSGLAAASAGNKRSHAEMAGQGNITTSRTSDDETARATIASTKPHNTVLPPSPFAPSSAESPVTVISSPARTSETPTLASHPIKVKDEPHEPVLYSIAQLRDSRTVQQVAAAAKDEKQTVVKTEPQKTPVQFEPQPNTHVDEEKLRQRLLARRQQQQQTKLLQQQQQMETQTQSQHQVDVPPRQASLPPPPPVPAVQRPPELRTPSSSVHAMPNTASLPPRPVSAIGSPRTTGSVPGSPSTRCATSGAGESAAASHAIGSGSGTTRMPDGSSGSRAPPAMNVPSPAHHRPPVPVLSTSARPTSGLDPISPATSIISAFTPAGTAGLSRSQSQPQVPNDDAPLPHPWLRRVSRQGGEIYYLNPQTKATTWTRPTTGADEGRQGTAAGSATAPSATSVHSAAAPSSSMAAAPGSSSNVRPSSTSAPTTVESAARPRIGSPNSSSRAVGLPTDETAPGVQSRITKSNDNNDLSRRALQTRSNSPHQVQQARKVAAASSHVQPSAPSSLPSETAPVSSPQPGDRRVSAAQLNAPATLPPRPPPGIAQPPRTPVPVPPGLVSQVDELPRRVMRPAGQLQPQASSSGPGSHQSLGLAERYTVTDRSHPPPSQRHAHEQSPQFEDRFRESSASSSSPAPKASLADRIKDLEEHTSTLADRMSPTHTQQQNLASRLGTKRPRDDFEHPHSSGTGPSKKRREMSIASSTSGPGNDLASRIGPETHQHQQYQTGKKKQRQQQQQESPQPHYQHKPKSKLEARMDMSDFGAIVQDGLDFRIGGYADEIGSVDDFDTPSVYLRSLSPPEMRVHPHAKQPFQQAARGGRGRGRGRGGLPTTRGDPPTGGGGRGGPPQAGGRGRTPTAGGHGGLPPMRGRGKGNASLKNRIQDQ